jgi:hypothetical protein
MWGVGAALRNSLSLVAPGGHFSVVLQLPAMDEEGVSSTNYTSMQTLKKHFALIEASELQRLLRLERFQLVHREDRPLSAGEALWLGVFAQSYG